MALVAFDINELDKKQKYRCLWCLVESSAVMNMVTCMEERRETLNIYVTEKQRSRALQYWRRGSILANTVFFLFEIPIDFYLEKAEKQI